MTPDRVADLTMEQLRDVIRDVVHEEEKLLPSGVKMPRKPVHSWIDVPVLEVDPTHTAFTAVGRADFYSDDDPNGR